MLYMILFHSKKIFENPDLTCQFLKDYSGMDIFANLRPEDIEDVTSRYQAYLGVEFQSDTVKKIKIGTDDKKQDIFVIPLIEHKSWVDYDVQMQLLRYMAVIWYDYGKEKNLVAGKELTAMKSFRYPPIIPIVYMEAKEMGYLFEHAEKMDIQAERRNTQEERERADKAEEELNVTKEQLNTAEEKIIKAETTIKGILRNLVIRCIDENLTEEETKNCLRDSYKISEKDLQTYFEDIWNNK